MAKKGLSIILMLTGIGIAAAAYSWTTKEQSNPDQVYRTANVSLGTLTETVIATGVIRPMVGAEINVGSRISGTVVSLPVEVGDEVKVGQLLAKLDASALQAAADSRLADVMLGQPRVKLAEATLRRSQTLANRGLVSEADLEIAKRDLAVERAQLSASEAKLRSANILLGYTIISSPIEGVVAEVTTREGETVAADFSAPTFVTILNLNRLEVLAYVDETDIGRIEVGQIANFTVDTYPEQEFKARVSAIQPRAILQGSVVNYVVRLDYQVTDDFILRPEMTAHLRLVIAERKNVLKIPRNTLKRKNGRQFVMVQRDGKWVEQDVRTGWRSESVVEIVSGVNAGSVLAINPS